MKNVQTELRRMVKELLADESDTLSWWECDFLDSVNRWIGDYSDKQAETIEKIWEKVFG